MTNFENIDAGRKGSSIQVSVTRENRQISVNTLGRGPKGERGLSAYEIWLSEGNIGTVEDFLNSLVPKGQATYVYNQVTMSKVWVINHNLARMPNVTIADTSGNVVLADIIYIDENTIEISFGEEAIGTAYLN